MFYWILLWLLPELSVITSLHDMGSFSFQKREAATQWLSQPPQAMTDSVIRYYPFFQEDPEIRLRVSTLIDSHIQSMDGYIIGVFNIQSLDYDVLFWYYHQEHRRVYGDVETKDIPYEDVIARQATRTLIRDQVMLGVPKESIIEMIKESLELYNKGEGFRWQMDERER